jgi:hypothetical protein
MMISKKQRAQIIAALKSNPNASAVTRQISGATYHMVWQIAKKADIKLSVGRPSVAAEKRPQIIAALAVNPNARAVAGQFGVSVTAVWQIAKKAEIKLAQGHAGKGSRLPPATHAKIIAGLKANPNAGAVARQVGGVSHQTVWKIAKKAGIALRARRSG